MGKGGELHDCFHFRWAETTGTAMRLNDQRSDGSSMRGSCAGAVEVRILRISIDGYS